MRKAREYRKESRELLGDKLFGAKWMWPLLLLMIAAGAISMASSITFGFAAFVIAGPIGYGLISVFLRAVRRQDEHAEIRNLWDGFRGKFCPSLVVELLNVIFVFLWSLLLIIPGIIKSYSYAGSMYLLHEYDVRGKDAITASRKLMKGRKWKLFCLDLSFIGWYIVGILCLGVGVLWVDTYHTMAKTLFFEDAMKECVKAGDDHLILEYKKRKGTETLVLK